jgi:hypothetical protein
VQIICCYENFCDKHIKEEIMKNFTCPNCKVTAKMGDIVPNKKLREDIIWYKNILAEAIECTKESHTLQISTHVPPVRMNNIITNLSNVQEEIQNSLKKLDIDIVVNKHEVDMTPDEKMQIYNNKLTEQTEEKGEDSSANQPDKMNPFMKQGDMMIPSIYDSNKGFDPRIYYSMMAAGYPYPMYPIMPGGEAIIPPMKKQSSSSSSSSSSSVERKKKKRHRSRDRSYSRDKKRSSKKRDKDRDRDRRDKSKDRHTSKKKKHK